MHGGWNSAARRTYSLADTEEVAGEALAKDTRKQRAPVPPGVLCLRPVEAACMEVVVRSPPLCDLGAAASRL